MKNETLLGLFAALSREIGDVKTAIERIESRIEPAAVALGRKGGLVKGRKGLAAMTPERRAEVQAMGQRAAKKARHAR